MSNPSRKSSSEIELGAIGGSDLRQMFHWRNDPRVYRWCRQHEPIVYDHHLAYWERVRKDPATRMYAVRAGGNLVGVCGLTSIDWINRRGEFSLYIGPEHQGQGLGEAALRALVKHGFNVLNLNSIWGESFETNPAMVMFDRVGFQREGKRRQFYFREGRYIDAILISLLKDEYDDRTRLDGAAGTFSSDNRDVLHSAELVPEATGAA